MVLCAPSVALCGKVLLNSQLAACFPFLGVLCFGIKSENLGSRGSHFLSSWKLSWVLVSNTVLTVFSSVMAPRMSYILPIEHHMENFIIYVVQWYFPSEKFVSTLKPKAVFLDGCQCSLQVSGFSVQAKMTS